MQRYARSCGLAAGGTCTVKKVEIVFFVKPRKIRFSAALLIYFPNDSPHFMREDPEPDSNEPTRKLSV